MKPASQQNVAVVKNSVCLTTSGCSLSSRPSVAGASAENRKKGHGFHRTLGGEPNCFVNTADGSVL